MATLKIKGYGTVTLELYPDLAPNTVNNFITLANSGFYDGLIFHRVIEDFMIQGGDPNGNGTGGPGYSIAGEFSSNGFTTNTLSHTKGVISMARAMNPDSAGSQFFIMSADGTYLDGQYAAFGKVISGLDMIEKIQLVDTNNQDKPLKDIVIESIRVSLGALKVTAPIKIEDK
ncbi:peptidylprolyl isomerase [Cellulosilyticum sp. WCF-2]|uniref:peptidylprolyl isomerase n=1 Tax=unclassified Cellulosilyticum TaxID=2643091 RepID=UPI002FE503E7